MSLLDRIKGIFSKQAVPDETRLLLEGVADVYELKRGLDDIITRNEVELKDTEREVLKLESIEIAEKEKVKAGTLAPREKENSLKAIKRLRDRMDSFKRRHKIYEDNIDLHNSLLAKISEMEAMELKAVKQEQIDSIATDYDERYEKHKEIIRAGRVASERESSYEDLHEKRELEKLEKEILGEVKPKEEPAKVEEKVEKVPEKKVEETAKAEPTKTEKPEKTREPLAVETEPASIKVPNEQKKQLELE